MYDSFIGKIIQCHIDRSDPESFVVGRLAHADNDWILMQDVSPIGRWNGLALYPKTDIVAIDERTEYLDKLNALLKCRNEHPSIIPQLSDDLLLSLLSYAMDSMQVIGIELYSSGLRDIDGTVVCLNDKTVHIIQLDEFGRPDGISYLSTEAITRLYVGDEDSKCLELLCNYYKQQQ